MREPEGVAVDAWGNVLVSDTGNDRIQRFDAGGAPIDTFGGNGTAAGKLIKPAQAGFDASGRLWVADPFNNRVQRYTPSTWTLAAAPSTLSVARSACRLELRPGHPDGRLRPAGRA